jgi:hypothetical protein
MDINIPKGFDTKVVTGGVKLAYIGKGMKESGIEKAVFETELIRPKYIEPRNGGNLAAFELRVDKSSDERVHNVGQIVSYNCDLNQDNGQVDCKRFMAKVLGAIAARNPGFEEIKDSAGNVIEKKVRLAAADDPNAVTSGNLVRALNPDDALHQMFIGTKLRAEMRVDHYTPTTGKNAGKPMSVERVTWTVLSRTPQLEAMQAQATAAIEKMNSDFKATLAAAKAA